MSSIVTIFACCVVVFAMAVYVYSRKEDTASDLLRSEIRYMKSELKRMEDIFASNVVTISNTNLKLQGLEMRTARLADEMDIVRDQVSETREKQISLRDDLSRKRPVVKMPSGPIQVEFYHNPKKPVGKGIKSLIKEKGH